MKILLVRHADAMSAAEAMTSGVADDDRALTGKGRALMETSASGLSRLMSPPDRIIHSPLRRAVETAEILAAVWPHARLVASDALRPADGPALLSALEGDCVLVGHEPSLSALAGWFMTGRHESLFSFSKGGVALLSFGGRPAAGSGKLRWLLPPDWVQSC